MILSVIYYLTENDLTSASAVLRVWGPDANTYLQGQFTQDLRMADGTAAYGLWLDQKGKVLADSHVLKLGDNHYMVVSFSMTAPQLLKRLEDYLIADEVELRDETAQWTGILLWGEGAGQQQPPSDGLALPSRRAGLAGTQWLVPVERSTAAGLEKNSAIMSDRPAVELARLRAGVPTVPLDIGPRDLPNEGGLEEVAVSYTKGCYLGQDVMGRLKNLGQVRRRLHLVQGPGFPPESGSALYQGERKMGETRSAAVDGKDFLGLAMISLVNLDLETGLSLTPGAEPSVQILRRV